ncbi:MAG TPA: YggS family pyridoxal phosphate-dependent enzyme, partial [Bacteroidetes bacterium]|nr:YggS family pyridoxal phosphate-dependent enzyme [Bacteroidota bacterium]
VRGLMGMGSLEGDLEVVRPQFRLLRELRDEYQSLNEGSLQLEELSMGMSHDLEVAIEEGATMVRVGTAIFGDRE